MLNKLIILLSLVLIPACSNGQGKDKMEKKNKDKTHTEECSKFYWFDNQLIDLEALTQVVIDVLPATDFKTCSKYAHRFIEPLNDSVSFEGRLFVVVNNKKTQTYQLQIIKDQKVVKTIQAPVEMPLPEVHEYYMHLLRFKNRVILMMSDMYSTHYRLVKYNSEGNELLRTDIEHTYITHPEPNTNYHHRYLYYFGISKSQMVFTSHMAFADKFKTILLRMDDFSIKEFDKMTHGIILDDKDEELTGFVTASEDYENKITNYHITMINGKNYDLTLPYGMSACNFLLKDNLLYIANYHPISTGSALQCFDMKTGKIKWTADVLQLNVGHSEYWNKVTLSFYKDKLIMEGNEAYGDYLQIFNAKTGERLAHFGVDSKN